jgi:glyceraldehyde-3-phosphate dehydrogenase type II
VAKQTTVTVIGTGTIGEPLIGLLAANKKQLGIDRVIFNKRTPAVVDRSKVLNLIKRGTEFSTDPAALQGFKDLGMEPAWTTEQAIEQADVVIDCTPEGVGFENKKKYYERHLSHANGFIAQGSEFGFGKMYARGINDEALAAGQDKFIQVVSCNTHNLAVILKALAFGDGSKDKNLDWGRFTIIRRANDVSNEKGFLASPEVGAHKDAQFGTHHARDVYHLYKTLGYELNVFSSAIKIPTQYMHTIYFHLRLKNKTTKEDVLKQWQSYPYASVTHKKVANMVYSFGRDHGHWGRLLDEAILVAPTVWVSPDGHEVAGYCFTPQDGNSLLSSMGATAFLLDPQSAEERMKPFDQLLFKEV